MRRRTVKWRGCSMIALRRGVRAIGLGRGSHPFSLADQRARVKNSRLDRLRNLAEQVRKPQRGRRQTFNPTKLLGESRMSGAYGPPLRAERRRLSQPPPCPPDIRTATWSPVRAWLTPDGRPPRLPSFAAIYQNGRATFQR